MRVLVIEDDDDLRLAVSGSLRGSGFAVDAVADLPAADQALAVNAYDCAVFDRMLPAGDALGYVRAARAAGSVLPVLFLTALGGVGDRIDGLEYGDDYLVKPFAMEELVARVRSLCRRVAPDRQRVLGCGDLRIDRGRHEVRRGGVLLTLTSKEFAVLDLLVERQGTPVTRAELNEHGWERLDDPGVERAGRGDRPAAAQAARSADDPHRAQGRLPHRPGLTGRQPATIRSTAAPPLMPSICSATTPGSGSGAGSGVPLGLQKVPLPPVPVKRKMLPQVPFSVPVPPPPRVNFRSMSIPSAFRAVIRRLPPLK